MSKRDTIIIAILVNSGLLLILFFAAITNTDKPVDTAYEVAKYVQPEQFSEAPVLTPPEQTSTVPELPEEKQQETIVHKLPKIVDQPQPLSLPIPEKKEPAVEESVVYHTVVRGDTLEKIAKKYHTTIFVLQQANNMNNTLLRIGKVLKVPKSLNQLQLPSVPIIDEKFYVVKSGDNPWTIAMKHHMKVSDLLQLNNLDNRKAKRLRPGDRLRIR